MRGVWYAHPKINGNCCRESCAERWEEKEEELKHSHSFGPCFCVQPRFYFLRYFQLIHCLDARVGPRGTTQVRMAQASWVRIPLQTKNQSSHVRVIFSAVREGSVAQMSQISNSRTRATITVPTMRGPNCGKFVNRLSSKQVVP